MSRRGACCGDRRWCRTRLCGSRCLVEIRRGRACLLHRGLVFEGARDGGVRVRLCDRPNGGANTYEGDQRGESETTAASVTSLDGVRHVTYQGIDQSPVGGAVGSKASASRTSTG